MTLNPDSFRKSPIYSALTRIYDAVMEEVDYESWADYIDDLIQTHAPGAREILELACGTGTVALLLDELGYYSITATDISPEMVGRAEEKARSTGSGVRFRPMNALEMDLEEHFDVVFMMFDSINYLQSEEEILRLHEQVGRVLRPGGLFLFDFTTPRHSREAVHYLDNETGEIPGYRYLRRSRYDAWRAIHTNEFEIEKLDPESGRVVETFVEVHQQKIYTLRQMMRILSRTGFHLVQSYDGLSFEPAGYRSLRITVVTEWP